MENSGKKIFLLEDDLSLISGLTFAFRKEGYELCAARSVREAKEQLEGGSFDLLILDVGLPDGTGFEVCEWARKASDVPIIFLTAADEEVNIIMGLEMGGDDYITKPFKLSVLLSRIHALFRRSASGKKAGTALSSNGIRVDLLSCEVTKEGVPLELTANEYKLLCLLMSEPGRVFSREQILGRLLDGDSNYLDQNALTVYIRRLRMKIEEDPGNPTRLLTVRGLGYKWSVG